MTKILHIEHPEDTILTGDTSFLQSIKGKQHLSMKIDGAPAIVWGINPATEISSWAPKVCSIK